MDHPLPQDSFYLPDRELIWVGQEIPLATANQVGSLRFSLVEDPVG